ncbi:hypothetical protein OCAE111667_25490 [Occultella aeris]|uniref:Uncharacterized protein n=1 Tax=Occultella aeris TaxID=2761496 RepID=A0A7M4DNX9_9MICO|nr:hypothetical protein [Occultella aeris]VZO39165.1 hypothetical protein HALOF300_03860 [Occultella aeris]
MGRRSVGAALAAVVGLVLAACGGLGGAPGSGGPPDDGPTVDGTTADPSGVVLVGMGLIMQVGDEPPQLCLGAVADSYPPQCGGPELIGFEGWSGIEHESASGSTWASAWVVGTYDGTSFRLTEPATAEPPAGWEPSADPSPDFPQLCDDDAARAGGGPTGSDLITQQSELSMFLETYDGYVLSYVSGGGDVMNVLVSGDAALARAQFRAIYAGPLCVQTSDLPLQSDVRAAQDALNAVWEDLDLLSSGSGVSGLLEVQLVVADPAHVEAVTEVVAPWLEPDELVFSGALEPFPS